MCSCVTPQRDWTSRWARCPSVSLNFASRKQRSRECLQFTFVPHHDGRAMKQQIFGTSHYGNRTSPGRSKRRPGKRAGSSIFLPRPPNKLPPTKAIWLTPHHQATSPNVSISRIRASRSLPSCSNRLERCQRRPERSSNRAIAGDRSTWRGATTRRSSGYWSANRW